MINIYQNYKKSHLVALLFLLFTTLNAYSQKVDYKVDKEVTPNKQTLSLQITITKGTPPFSVAIFNGNPAKGGKLVYTNESFNGLTLKQTLAKEPVYYIIVYSKKDEDGSQKIVKL